MIVTQTRLATVLRLRHRLLPVAASLSVPPGGRAMVPRGRCLPPTGTPRRGAGALAAAADPVTAEEFGVTCDALGLAPGSRVVVALSGGVDSTALCWLASGRFRPEFGGAVVAVAVDHGLRDEATAEAAAAVDNAATARHGPGAAK